MTQTVTRPQSAIGQRRARRTRLVSVLFVALTIAVILNLGAGAVAIAPSDVVAILARALGLPVDGAFTEAQASVLTAIRAPRVVLCGLTGAVLATSGAALQAVFRNPLADPSVIGVSSGAAVGAVGVIVLGTGTAVTGSAAATGVGYRVAVPAAAFAGGLIAVLAVYALSRRDGRTEVVTMVLTGVAVTAICGALVGLLTFLANDAQLRTIVFWTLGSVGGATWPSLSVVAPLLALAVAGLVPLGRPLNALVLGEREARHVGVDTERIRLLVVGLAALGVGASVAVAGIIGFVGLVVPHLIRLAVGPDHRLLLPASALGGATILLAADLVARTVAVPAELPLGVVTALAGGPAFLILLLRTRHRQGGWG